MKTFFSILLLFIMIACSNNSTKKIEKLSYSDSLKKIVMAYDSVELLKPIPKELLVFETTNDSDIVMYNEKCVVFSNYSKGELAKMEKESKSTDEWEAFYDDYSYYANEASSFLYEKTTIKSESNKRFIQFIFATGEKITIDRYKSAGLIFFFNPMTGVKQCDTFGFDQNKYNDY